MTQVWDADNRLVPVTVVEAGPCVVTQVRNADTDGYDAVQIAYGAIDPRKVNKPMAGPLREGRASPRAATSSRSAPPTPASYELGQELTVELFEAGQDVDVVGTTKGKGFAGVMKRHGFHGVGSSHGAHRNHRKPGSIGGCATPGRVFKGMRMAGRMGGVRQTTQNLTVHAVDAERGLLLIKGAVPGPKRRHRPRRARAREGGLNAMTDRSTSSTPDGQDRRHRRPARRGLRRPDQHPADPPGRRGPARRRPPGHALHQDPRRGPRWWQEALPAEGHRPRPSGLDPRAAVRRRWRRPRPARRATTRSGRPRR